MVPCNNPCELYGYGLPYPISLLNPTKAGQPVPAKSGAQPLQPPAIAVARAARDAGKSDFRTPVESIGLQKPEMPALQTLPDVVPADQAGAGTSNSRRAAGVWTGG